MKTCFTSLFFPAFVITALAIVPLCAQAQFVYVNDNSLANTVTEFTVAGNMLVSPTPFVTTGAGLPGVFAANQQGVATYNNLSCLFVSDPNSSSSFPTGDVAAFSLTGGTPTLVANSFDPTNTFGANKGIPLAIDRQPGFPYVFAAFTGEQKIVYFKVNTVTCQLVYVSSTTAVGLSGQPVAAMAVSPAGPHILVVTYQDGSIQSFKVTGATLIPTAPPFQSTGNATQGGMPAGLDITANGKFVIFGDSQTVTEVEVSKINPTGTLTPTVDYGGPAVASGVNLGTGVNSSNVWISPGVTAGNNFVYVSNNNSGQVTTLKLAPSIGLVTAIPSSSCTGAFTNPTTLNNTSAWLFSGHIQTQQTSGTGNIIYVAEYGTPSSVAELKVQATGCTREALSFGSPFTDVNSNAARSLSVFPPRPF